MNVIAVWFSCGAASAIAAKLTIEKYGKYHKILIVNNPIKEEHPDNFRFLQDVQNWLDHEILFASSKEYPSKSIVEVFDKRKYMSGRLGAPCTMILKKQARYNFEDTHKIDFNVLGFTLEEQNRHDRFIKFEKNNLLPVLIEANITKGRCFELLKESNIKLPEIYNLGFPNANCIGCVKSQSPTYWNLVRVKFPEIFKERAEQSRRIGCKLVKVKGKNIYLDELSENENGRKIKSYDCGMFCDLDYNYNKFIR